MLVHPLRSCLSVNISSNVETVFGSVLCEVICLLCPISSSNSMLMLQPRMPQASSSLLTNISTPILWRSSHGKRTSVQANKCRCFASRSVVVSMSATCWIASSLNVGRWKSSSSSMGSWWGFVLFGGVSVAGVQLDPGEEKRRKKKSLKFVSKFSLTVFTQLLHRASHRYTSKTHLFHNSPMSKAHTSAGFSATQMQLRLC